MTSTSRQELHLIIAGNKKVDPFANTLRAVAKNWGSDSIRSVYLTRFDSEEEAPDWRNLSNRFFQNLSVYQEVVMRDPKLYAKVFSDLLRELIINKKIERKFIIVDLTNATKTWCDLVYLVCTLMQVKQAFRLKLPPQYFNLPFNEVDISLLNLELEPIIDIDDLRTIVRSTYSEYVCYLREIDSFIAWIEKDSLINIDTSQVYASLLKSLDHHIRGDYESCIMKASTVLELILDEILRVLQVRFDVHWNFLTDNKPKPLFNSLGSKAQTLGQVCTRINYFLSALSNKVTASPEGVALQSKKAKEVSQFAPLIATGFILQSLGSIRNYSGHGGVHSSSLQTELESQQMLSSVTYTFGKVRLCELFRK